MATQSQNKARNQTDTYGLVYRKLDSYRDKVGTLGDNLTEQLIFIVVSLFVIMKRKATLDIPFLGKEVPSEWVHALCAVVLLYLWVQFGFLLDELIKTRMEGWELLHAKGAPSDKRNSNFAASLFNDGGVVDGWFLLFRPTRISFSTDYKLVVGVCYALFLGLFLAVAHSCTLVAIHAARLRFSAGGASTWFWSGASALCLFLLIGTHWIFAYAGGNPNWFQIVIAAFVCLLVWGLSSLVSWEESQLRRLPSPLVTAPKLGCE